MYSYGFIRQAKSDSSLICASVVRRSVGEGGFCYYRNPKEHLHVFSYATNFANLDSFLLWGGYEILGLCLTCFLNLLLFCFKIYSKNTGFESRQTKTTDLRCVIRNHGYLYSCNKSVSICKAKFHILIALFYALCILSLLEQDVK